MKSKKELHVVYIITKLELGGAQKVCLSLFHDIPHNSTIIPHLMSGDDGILTPTVAGKKNVTLISSLKRELSLLNALHELRSFFRVFIHLRSLKKKYPHIIVHTHSTKAGILGRWAAFFAGIKHRIHTVHGYSFHEYQRTPIWLMHYVIELITSFITSHYICVSSYDVKKGIQLFPFFSRKHSIIRAAIEWQQFYQPARTLVSFPENNSTFIFGTIACFKPQKNMFDLLRAFHTVHRKHPHTRLEIIGDGTQRREIEQWIAEHHLTHAITLHGWQEKVAPIMINWHAFVLTSLWEGLPCAIIEARLLKLPIVSYDTGGIHDVIFSGENGVLHQKGNWEQLAQTMSTIASNKKLHSTLSQHKDQLQDFHQRTMVHEHISLYEHFIT